MIHGLNVASRFNCDGVSGIDLAGPDCVFCLTDLMMLIVPVEYTVQVFSVSSKIFSEALATLNLQVIWIASPLARYKEPKHDFS